MEKFNEICNTTHRHGEKNDCTVVATALVTGLPYDVVHKAFADAGRKNGQGCAWSTQIAAWKTLGYEPETVYVGQFKADSNISGLKKGKFVTTRQIKEYRDEWFKYFPPFLAYCSRHVAAVVDGKLEDWTAKKDGKQFYRFVFLHKIEN